MDKQAHDLTILNSRHAGEDHRAYLTNLHSLTEKRVRFFALPISFEGPYGSPVKGHGLAGARLTPPLNVARLSCRDLTY